MKKNFILFLFFSLITFISNAQTDCAPVTITNVVHEGVGNRLTWTPPSGSTEVVISHSGNYNKYLGGGDASFGVYHRFIPEQLSTVNEGTLSQVVFVPTHPIGLVPGHTYTVQIYQGGVWGAPGNRTPGTLIASQELHNENLTFNQENTITLETPVTIDASQELWIGCFCTNIDSITIEYKCPFRIDDGPVKDGFGNLMFYQNEWITLFELQSLSTFNFCIKGKVQTPDGATVNIYCNDAPVASNIAGVTWLHEQPEGEKQCYKVEVNCVEGGVSPLSDEFCITWDGIGNYAQTGSFTVYPNPAKNELHVTCHSSLVTNIEVFDVFGRIQSHLSLVTRHENGEAVIDVSGLVSGVYFVRIMGEKGYSVQRFVKE